MRRLGLRNKPGKKPEWKWTVKTGKLTRRVGTGIDWWRYQQEVILPKIIPFAKELGPDALVQEDNAPAHSHVAQGFIYKHAEVQRLIWVPNSPDLNMIEPCWFYMKRETTKKGAPQSRVDTERK